MAASIVKAKSPTMVALDYDENGAAVDSLEDDAVKAGLRPPIRASLSQLHLASLSS